MAMGKLSSKNIVLYSTRVALIAFPWTDTASQIV